ncbi:MAG: hypothetical protein WCS43_11150 [Verrucomicrobiota bacterium]
MKRTHKTGVVFAFLASAAAWSTPLPAAEAQKPPLDLASPFGDGAALQRGLEVPVWGWQDNKQMTRI